MRRVDYSLNATSFENVRYPEMNTMRLTIVEASGKLKGHLSLKNNYHNINNRDVNVDVVGNYKEIGIYFNSDNTLMTHSEKKGDLLFTISNEDNNLLTHWKLWYPRYRLDGNFMGFIKDAE